METGIKVGDVMQSRLVSIDSEKTVLEAAKLMKKNNIGSVLIEDSGRISGIVTHTDLVERCLAEGKSVSCKLKEVMSKPLIGVEPDADISDAAKLMGNEDLRRLVVFKQGRIVGIVSEKDIIKISPSLYDLIAEKVEGHLR
ncbi:MAG: CBS domain-containing protein [Candidatus Aenigmatarchaeota archaeon]